MLNSGENNSSFARQKKNILTLVLSEKKNPNEIKNQTPPPFKLNGRSFTDIFVTASEIVDIIQILDLK